MVQIALLCPSRTTNRRYTVWNTLPLVFTAALATWLSTLRCRRIFCPIMAI